MVNMGVTRGMETTAITTMNIREAAEEVVDAEGRGETPSYFSGTERAYAACPRVPDLHQLSQTIERVKGISYPVF